MNSAKYIADRIRLMIATRQFQVGEVLPSTRILGKQLDASFHTVRKAYHALADEGLLTSETGRGFIVRRQTVRLDKSERLEMGAAKMRQILEEMIGYGLNEDEIEVLFEEQLRFVDWPERIQTCAAIGTTREHSDMIARAIRTKVGVSSDTATWLDETRFANYDALFVPAGRLHAMKLEYEDLLLIPVIFSPDPEMILALADLPLLDGIGIVTGEDATISHIIDDLKWALRYNGTMMAGSVYGKSLPLFVRDVDVVIYTPAAAALVERQIPEKRRMLFRYTIAEQSAEAIRAELWDQ